MKKLGLILVLGVFLTLVVTSLGVAQTEVFKDDFEKYALGTFTYQLPYYHGNANSAWRVDEEDGNQYFHHLAGGSTVNWVLNLIPTVTNTGGEPFWIFEWKERFHAYSGHGLIRAYFINRRW